MKFDRLALGKNLVSCSGAPGSHWCSYLQLKIEGLSFAGLPAGIYFQDIPLLPVVKRNNAWGSDYIIPKHPDLEDYFIKNEIIIQSIEFKETFFEDKHLEKRNSLQRDFREDELGQTHQLYIH